MHLLPRTEPLHQLVAVSSPPTATASSPPPRRRQHQKADRALAAQSALACADCFRALAGGRRDFRTRPESATVPTASTSATRRITAACVPPPPAPPSAAPSAASAGAAPQPVLSPRVPAKGLLPTPAPLPVQVDGGLGARALLFSGGGADRLYCRIRRRVIVRSGFGCLPGGPPVRAAPWAACHSFLMAFVREGARLAFVSGAALCKDTTAT